MSAGTTESVRCVWEITAGLIPGTPEKQFTKRFALSSREWHEAEPEKAKARYEELEKQAEEYAHSLRDPARLNWVRLDWVWF